jgi:hypothetical protein
MKHHINQEEKYVPSEFSEDMEADPVDHRRKLEIKKKLEERMEKRRLKQELEDYEGELDSDFNWDNFDK